MLTTSLRRRTLTGGLVAYSVWLLAGQIVITKLTQRAYTDFAVLGGGAGDLPGRPDPLAIPLVAFGGIPAIDTADGFPSFGDVWEEIDPVKGRLIRIATGDGLEFGYSQEVYAEPVGGMSAVTGRAVSRGGRVITLTPADVIEPTLETLSLTPGSRARFSGKVDCVAGVLTVDETFLTNGVSTISRSVANHRSVTFDATTNANTGGTAASSVTLANHPVANQADRYLAATAVSRGGQNISSIVFNAAETLTNQSNFVPAGIRVVYHDLVAPTATTANIVVTWDAATSGTAGAWSAYGVDQTTPRTTLTTNNGSGSAPTVTVSSATGELVVSTTGSQDNNPITVDATWTQDWNHENTDGNKRHSAGAHKAGAASVTRTDSTAGNPTNNWVAIGVSLKASAGAPSTVIQDAVMRGMVVPFPR